MKLRGSNLVTAAGLILLLAVVLAAAFLHYSGLELLGAALLILCGVAWLWTRAALSKIEVEQKQESCYAFPGETMGAEISLKNNKLLPVLWLEAEFPMHGKTCIAPAYGDRESLKDSFLWVMGFQSLSWHQSVVAEHRGVCRFTDVVLNSGDGFGLSERSVTVKLGKTLRYVVYPKLIQVNPEPIHRHLRELEQAKSGLYTDQTLIRTIRAYQPGDSIRDINWRQVARQGDLQVNVREKQSMRRVCFALNLESFVYLEEMVQKDGKTALVRRVYRDEMERMFSAVASLVDALSERDVVCSLIIPGIGGEDGNVIVPENRRDQTMHLLTALAEVEFTGQTTSFPEEKMFRERHKLGAVFCYSRTPQSANSELYRLFEDTGIVDLIQIPDPSIKTERAMLLETEVVL